jgi:putative transcriptional regulator
MENAVQLGVTFKEAGFQVSQICCSRSSCFDFVARRNGKLLLVKVDSDVDTFSPQSSRELRVIASRVSSASLVVSRQTHGKPLQDDTVYSRYGVFVVTEKTVKNLAFEMGNPLVFASPGGYSVEIDGKLIEKRRIELGLSIGQLAEMIGVSRRTLYSYERGTAKASVTPAYRIEETLGVAVAKPINVFEKTKKQRQCLLMKTKHAIVAKTVLCKVLKKFASCDISPVHKAPFDFIMNDSESKSVIIGCVAAYDESNLKNRIEETESFCRVTGTYPVLITEKEKSSSEDIPCFCLDELSLLRSPEDLIVKV